VFESTPKSPADAPSTEPLEGSSEAGFTLLEIVIAIGLAVLLISFGSSAVIAFTQAERRRLEVFERDPLGDVVLDRMEREISATLLLERPDDVPVEDYPWIFFAESDEREGGQADTLRFVTEAPVRIAGAPVGGAFRVVTYKAQVGANGRLNLYRTEQALPTEGPVDPPIFEDPATLEDIARFDVALIDDEKGVRTDSWNSIELQKDRLPERVELRLQLNSPKRDGEGTRVPGRVFSRSIALPVRPLGGDDDEDASCPGPSLAECISRFEEVLSTLGPQAEEAIASLVDQVEDPRCFQTVAATPTGSALVDELRQLTQLEPAEVCQ